MALTMESWPSFRSCPTSCKNEHEKLRQDKTKKTRKSLSSKVHKHQHSWKVKPEEPEMVKQFVAECPENTDIKSKVAHCSQMTSFCNSRPRVIRALRMYILPSSFPEGDAKWRRRQQCGPHPVGEQRLDIGGGPQHRRRGQFWQGIRQAEDGWVEAHLALECKYHIYIIPQTGAK